jgi:hypothetical protein
MILTGVWIGWRYGRVVVLVAVVAVVAVAVTVTVEEEAVVAVERPTEGRSLPAAYPR